MSRTESLTQRRISHGIRGRRLRTRGAEASLRIRIATVLVQLGLVIARNRPSLHGIDQVIQGKEVGCFIRNMLPGPCSCHGYGAGHQPGNVKLHDRGMSGRYSIEEIEYV